jgi:hypothetical protein
MQDDAHRENVWPLLGALKATGQSIDDFCDVGFIMNDLMELARKASEANKAEFGEYDCCLYDICFATGYLQATSNLTGKSWKDQLNELDNDG